MIESIVSTICFYNGKMLRTEIDVKYVDNKAVIVSLNVPISSTFEQSLSMIYLRTKIDKERFQLILNCRYPLKRENRFQPCLIWDDNSLSQMLKLVNTFGMEKIELYIEQVSIKRQMNPLLGNVKELNYGYGSDNTPVALTYGCRADEDKEECETQEGDDQSEGAEDVQHHVHDSLEFMGKE